MERFAKFLVRFTVLYATIYFLLILFYETVTRQLIYNDAYIVFLELCVAVFCSVQGNYHCKYMKYLAWGVFLADTFTKIDNILCWLPIGWSSLVPAAIIFVSLGMSFAMVLQHFRKVQRIKKQKNATDKRGTEAAK